MDKTSLQDFYAAIGKLTVAWAVAEHGLDLSVASIFHKHGGSSIVREVPRNAKAKISLFRKAFTEIEAFERFKPLATKIADHFSTTLLLRNWCVHGFAENAFNGVTDNALTLRRMAYPHFASVETKTVTQKDIERCFSDSTELCVAFGLILYKPLNVLPEDHIKNVFSGFGIEIPAMFSSPRDLA